MSTLNGCYHQDCSRPGPMGLGWGLSTGLVQWYCPDHFVSALARLSRLLDTVKAVTARAA